MTQYSRWKSSCRRILHKVAGSSEPPAKTKDKSNKDIETLVKLAEEIRTHKGSTVGLQNKVFDPDFAAAIEGVKEWLNN